MCWVISVCVWWHQWFCLIGEYGECNFLQTEESRWTSLFIPCLLLYSQLSSNSYE